MFSATKLLGGLMDNGLGGSNMLGTAAKVAGVAAVGGVAYGAYRHYQAGGFGQGGPGLFGGPSPAPGAAPQLNPFAGAAPTGSSPFAGAASPPAPSDNPWGSAAGGNPWAAPAAPSDSVPSPATPTPVSPDGMASRPSHNKTREETQALLLVRAMIAAAHVDGRLDARERENIVSGAATAGLVGAEREALEHELAHPQRPNLLLGAVDDVELARQVYLVTLLAVDRDNATEQAYVAGLPIYLGLTPADVVAIHQHLGLSG